MTSVADRFVEVMAKVYRITEGIDNDQPHRYPIRCMQVHAMNIIENSLDEAAMVSELMMILKDEMK